MENSTTSTPDRSRPASHSASPTINMSSPVMSVFSKGHSSRGSGSTSSIASSPIPRESSDLYGSRLGKVTEEPQEREDLEGYTLVGEKDDGADDYERYFTVDNSRYTSADPTAEYTLGDQDDWSTTSSGQHYPKRQRSMDHSPSSVSNRFSNRFTTISRRWKNRSGAGPQLSLITHQNPPSRSSSTTSAQIVSPALGAISKHESYLPPSPVRTTLDEALFDSDTMSILIPQTPPQEEDQGQATTPLLPPVLTGLARKDSPIHSPLQSPSIAPTSVVLSSRTSFDTPPMTSLPSPPLSTKPSVVSMHQRSRTTTTNISTLPEIPPMQLLDEFSDSWALQLGHANFSIQPEPYLPERSDLDSYTEFRANWDRARTSYAKHLARTIEHYGSTSRVFNLTEKKWNSVDETWKKYNELMMRILAPVLARSSDGDTDMHDSLQGSTVLEKPITKVIIPAIDDKSGKFPELGDGEIVGPMAVGPPRSMAAYNKSTVTSNPPASPRKRTLFRFLTDVFGRNQ